MQGPSAPPIVLASASPYRRGLLHRFLDDFQTAAPGLDETPAPGEAPRVLVRRLARQKAEAVSARHREALVIGGDQLAVLDGEIVGKPGDHENALLQLLACSGKVLEFMTAVCVLDPVAGRLHEHTDDTEVRFRRFDRRLAEAYLRRDRPYDCAGSFRIEGAAFVLLEAVTTRDPTALIGLPMIWLAATLRELGVGPA
jgi:septum formation protein